MTDNVTRLADLLIECSDLYGSIDKAARWLDAQGVVAKDLIDLMPPVAASCAREAERQRCAEIVRRQLEILRECVECGSVGIRWAQSGRNACDAILAEIERGEREET